MKTILKMENVKKSFGSGHNEIQALKGIDLAVNQGEFVSIIGPSGSGKSTFLTIAGGLQSPTSGNISINGLDFTPLSEKKRSKLRFKEIGFILQSSNLIPYLTIEEQFLLIDKINHEKLTSKKGIELLKSLDILDLKDKHPSDISGGERQRAAIARALFNEPNLILADEPTASLDTEHAYQVVELLRQEAHLKNKATIMVTHDQRMIKNSDSIYKIEDGLLSKI
ncbi:ABC transporter ATP-binding protein [Lactococcus lactis subsp. lactis]|uniref:ABC transporter ATP-binding protein n=1 Tax=Lactococcus lactis TaxID=1358 RepID=UPI0007AE4722|nr:ABC transporter ATP-binding protein [Lactococcus lactis]ARD93156.1 ABC transporter ATP-binding protein [Lactococcus lactis subsp. lactis]KZK08805.1 ABC transporter ATP-binding protein [Lactococcus lactis subsp. lactis bv. diacetylactis]MCT3104325.1 ABC transporter ATP-binding protein [Lactococcus lactis]MRL66227.1 ATP-binding cassette domain-containing protein [Lactococcus lactis subsp. lactis]QTP12636.1 ABC transporter ATP-binding protein [Lactococcus lactis subsp. lactis]